MTITVPQSALYRSNENFFAFLCLTSFWHSLDVGTLLLKPKELALSSHYCD